MADYYTPWGEASGGFDRLGQAASNVLLQLAQNKAGMARAGYEYDIDRQRLQLEREQNKERGALYKAQSALAAADEALTKKKADEIQVGQDLAGSFGETIRNVVLAQQGVTPLHEPSLRANAAGIASRLAALGNQHIVENLAQGTSYNDDRLRALMATKTPLPTHLGVNQMPVNYATGMPELGGFINQPSGYKATNLATGQVIENPEKPFDAKRTLGSTLGPVVSLLNGVRATNTKAVENATEPDPNSVALEKLLTDFVTKATETAASDMGGGAQLKQFKTAAEAKAAGAVGVPIMLWDEQSQKYRKAKVD